MVSEGIAKKTKGESMDSSVQQRGFSFDECERAQCMGDEMSNGGNVSQEKEKLSLPRSHPAGDNYMDGCDTQAIEVCLGESEMPETISMGSQNKLGSVWALEAASKLTPRNKNYLKAYLSTGSPSATAKQMGVQSVKEVGKRISKIAKRLGFTSVAAMKSAAGIKPSSDPIAGHTELMRLLKQQEFKCALSGVELSPTTARLDHKLAVSRGGSHEIANLQWVTDEVNRAKGTMSNDEFIATCRQVAAWTR